MRIGLLGGTFNPIHLGHLHIARVVQNRLKLDKVFFIPTGKTPHKKEVLLPSGADRYQMVKRAIQDNPSFHACNIEITRPGFSYTYDTITALKKRHLGATFFFIIGTDAFRHLAEWKHPLRLLGLCSFVVVPRANHPFIEMPDLPVFDRINHDALLELDEKKRTRYTFPTSHERKIYFLRISPKPMASRVIRDRIRFKESVLGDLPEQVLSYIIRKKFYQSEVRHS